MAAPRAVPRLLALLASAATAGADVPASFDCGMRKLAYEFGKQLLPRQGAFESLYYALNLNSKDCLVHLEHADVPTVAPTAGLPVAAVFVDPVRGVDDAGRGSETAPLRSLQRAVASAPKGGTVILRAGTHYLEEALLLGPEHSGLTLAAYPGEQPVVSGGKKVEAAWRPYQVDPPTHFDLFQDTNVVSGTTPDDVTITDLGKQPNSDLCMAACAAAPRCTGFTWHDADQGQWANFCWGRLDGEWPAVQQGGHFSGRRTLGRNIYQATIKGQVEDVPGLQLDGARATRARYPNLPGGIEVSPGYGYMIDGGDADWTPPQFDKFGPVAYYTDKTAEHLRNTTADDWFQQYMIGVGGLCSVYDPPVSYWCSEKPSGGGAFPFRTPSGVTPKPGKLPNSPYKDVSSLLLHVWRPARWANWMFEVASYDAAKNNFTFGRGGNQGARGENTGGDFFVEGVLEELDNPGEFYFDKAAGELYLFYNGTGAPPPDMEVVVPQIPVLVNLTGTQWAPVRNVTIDGLTFKATRYTYMEPHGVPSAGDWALDRISAVFLQGTEGVTVKNSVFERLDGNAVMISGYNRNATVQGNDFAYIGGNAIISWGYTNETKDSGFPYYTPRTNFPQAGVDGTDGNHPRFNAILGNSAREVGLYEKQSSFYMQAKTAQSTISGNVFFNGPRAGVNYNDGFGGGDELSHNLIFSTCRESGDHGPFNSWDRQPYLTDVRTGEPSMVMQWREIHHNFLIDNYSPQENIDNDDGSCWYKSHDNFMVYGGQGMKNDFGGHDNWHFNNVYAYPDQVLGLDKTLEGHEDYFYNNTAVITGTSVGDAQCSGARTQMHGNRYFTPTGSIQLCGKDLPAAQQEGMDQGSQVDKTPSDDVIFGWARAVLSIQGAAPEAVAEGALVEMLV